MAYEPVYETFAVVPPDGQRRTVRFKRAGFLSVGDQPEVYFFDVDGRETVVAVSGEALRQFQRPPRRALSREEKIDVAGLRLKQEIESGRELAPENLYINGLGLEQLMRSLGLMA